MFSINFATLEWKDVVKSFDVFGDFAETVQASERVEVELRIGAIVYHIFLSYEFFRPFSDFEKRVVALQIEDEQADFLRFVFRVISDDIAQKHV